MFYSPNMLPKHRGSYLVLRIGLNHLNPSGFLLLASCSPAAACLLLPACCCLRLPATYLLACCCCLPRLLPAARLLLLLASAACFLPLLPHAWCFPRRRLSGLIWLRPGSGWRLRSEALPLPRLEITLIRPCRTMRKYADKRHVDVATLRPFG